MPSLSLQTHLVNSCPQLSAISVDPRGFKAALRSLTQFLIEQQVSATLWLKLPKDKAWWTDVWMYGQQAAGCGLYALGDQMAVPPENLAANLRSIAIEQDEDLKREYLCLAVASNFVCVLLAVRASTGEQIEKRNTDKRTIKLYCSTAGHTVATLSVGLKRIIEKAIAPSVLQADALNNALGRTSDSLSNAFSDTAFNIPSSTAVSAAETAADSAAMMASRVVLSQWDHCFPADLLKAEALPLTEAFLSWQLQSQEEMRSQLTTYRNATKQDALSAYSLSADFLAQAGQELQSPLTTIKTALTLLGSPTIKMVQRQRYLEMISTQCDRQKLLINSVINLLKAQTSATLTPHAIQLADLIPGIVSTYQPIAEERGIMLAHTIPAHLTEVLSVEQELKEVVIQLINNGIQMTPKGGRVWVSANPHNDAFVALSVQDSGAGLSKHETARLFDAFYHNPSNREGSFGSGLGLTLVQQLVHRIGGSISVESESGRGTTFKILLPTRPTATTAQPAAINRAINRAQSSESPLAATSKADSTLTNNAVGAYSGSPNESQILANH
jgi:two-component system, OmpR family, phosphate regulon sensor histidine kinase PhoR